MYAELGFSIPRTSAAVQTERGGGGVDDRLDEQLVVAPSVDHAEVHRPSRVEPMVVGEIPRQASGGPQIRVDDVLKQQ